MSYLSISLGLTPHNPTFREIGKREIVDGKQKIESKQAISARKLNKGKPGCLRISQQASISLRKAIIRTLKAGGKYNARTMAEKVCCAKSAAMRHLRKLAEDGIAKSETDFGRYDVTWFWIDESCQ